MASDAETPTSYNLAGLWRAVWPRVSDRTAVVCGDTRRTYGELAERVDRLTAWLAGAGVTRGDHIGIHMVNGPEYLETMLAAFSLGAVPINVNFRYQAAELEYLYRDAELVGVVHHRAFAPRIAAIHAEVPAMRWTLWIDDGSEADVDVLGGTAYEEALAAASDLPELPAVGDDDLYVIYTGGTTGLPKGVVWRQEDAFFACIGGGDPMRLAGPVERPEQVLERIVDGTFVFFPVAPLMHAAGQWTAISWLLAGGTVVLAPGSLDPDEVWRAAQRESVNVMAVVGDPVVRPLLDAWDRAGGYELPSLFSIGSGGAPLSPVLKERLMAALPGVVVVDGFGSSETGAQGAERLAPGEQTAGLSVFTPYGTDSVVVDPTTLELVEPGSELVGRVARRGHIPLRYHNDPERTAASFVEFDGDRWVLTGDMATVAADGRITLLGRGSVCINTGGEKVHPEEVEAVLKAHPDIYDAVVVGVPDERWGQAVAAVVQPVPGASPTLDTVVTHIRSQLADYKAPRHLAVVDQVVRSPAGKADYRWAQAQAEAASTG